MANKLVWFWQVVLVISLCCCTVAQLVPIILHCESDNRVDVEETLVDSPIIGIDWLGNNADTKRYIFARSRSNLLYRSVDEGRKWTAEAVKFANAKGNQGNRNTPFGITQMEPSPSDNDVIWFLGNGNDTWVTKDRGETYTFKDSGFSLYELKPHPNKPGWALAYSINWSPFYLILRLTTNFGETWNPILPYVGAYFWGDGDKIWAEGWPQSGVQQFSNRWDTTVFYSVDAGATWISRVNHAAGSIMKFNTLFVAQLVTQDGPLKLYFAKKLGEEPLKMAQIPLDVEEKRYTILDITEDAEALSVEHEDPTWGNIYFSDSSTNQFVLSLLKSTRDVYGHVDFTKVENLKGIYIANYFKDIFAIRNGDTRSLITFNNGGEWTPLKAPQADSTGNPIDCVGECNLHLYGDHKLTANGNEDLGMYGPLHSKNNAIGLLMGTGNVGKYLDASVVNTYFSHNAGQTWAEVRKGSHIYEFGDHGGIIVMARNKEDTDRLLYSWNMGIAWKECRFTNNSRFQVLDIVSEPNNTAQTFVLHGTRKQNGRDIGVLVHLNFNGFHQRACNDTDYEQWSPFDMAGSNCFLGQKTIYTRRKRESECYNPVTYEPKKSNGVCECAQQDYECDYCYEPYLGDGFTCLYTCGNGTDVVSPPENCQGYYDVSRGYRKVEGTMCQGGLDLNPERVACPQPPHTPSTGDKGLSSAEIAVIVVLVITFMSVLLIGCVLLVTKNDRVRGLVLSGYGRLPSSIRDPFKGTSFVRIDNLEEEEEDLISRDEH